MRANASPHKHDTHQEGTDHINQKTDLALPVRPLLLFRASTCQQGCPSASKHRYSAMAAWDDGSSEGRRGWLPGTHGDGSAWRGQP